MMIGWWEHSQKGVTDGRTDRRTDGRTDGRTDWTIHRAAWSQLKTWCCEHYGAVSQLKIILNLMVTCLICLRFIIRQWYTMVIFVTELNETVIWYSAVLIHKILQIAQRKNSFDISKASKCEKKYHNHISLCEHQWWNGQKYSSRNFDYVRKRGEYFHDKLFLWYQDKIAPSRKSLFHTETNFLFRHAGYVSPSDIHGPLARYEKLRVANAPGIPERFPRHRALAIPTCITARGIAN